jgi:putative addiction module CopG family antidote
MNVSLTNDLRNFIRQKVENGEFPSEEAVLQEAVRRFRQQEQNVDAPDDTKKATPEELIDHEFIAYCTREADDTVSLEEVLQATSKIKDSMARVVIEEERAERF